MYSLDYMSNRDANSTADYYGYSSVESMKVAFMKSYCLEKESESHYDLKYEKRTGKIFLIKKTDSSKFYDTYCNLQRE
jgi:hypothetical protein